MPQPRQRPQCLEDVKVVETFAPVHVQSRETRETPRERADAFGTQGAAVHVQVQLLQTCVVPHDTGDSGGGHSSAVRQNQPRETGARRQRAGQAVVRDASTHAHAHVPEFGG
eukprot:2719964-Pyramimonas_sp.AAC.1